MEIKNRRVEYPNRVRLQVTQIDRNPEGEVISIQGNLIRDEGEVYEEGFAINERNINILLKKYYTETLNDVWENDNRHSEFYIDTLEEMDVSVYLENNPENPDLNFIVSYVNSNRIKIEVTPNNDFSSSIQTSQVEYTFFVDLKHKNTNNLFVQLTGRIIYYNDSIFPID